MQEGVVAGKVYRKICPDVGWKFQTQSGRYLQKWCRLKGLRPCGSSRSTVKLMIANQLNIVVVGKLQKKTIVTDVAETSVGAVQMSNLLIFISSQLQNICSCFVITGKFL